MFDHFLIVAEMAEEPRVEQMHDGVFLPSDVQIHRQPVIRQRCVKRATRERNGRRLQTRFAPRAQIRPSPVCMRPKTNDAREEQ